MNARILKQLGLAVAVLVGTAVFSGAGISLDVPLPGTRIRLNDTSGPAGRRTYVALRDGDQSIPLPDPRVTGATVTIGRVGVGDVTVLDLPAAGWGGGTTPRKDYKFKSKGGTVVAARIIAGHSVRISAAATAPIRSAAFHRVPWA